MSGGGGGGSQTVTQQNYSPEETADRGDVRSEAKRIYGATAPQMAASGYPGSQVVPYGAHTAAGMNTLWDYAVNQLPGFLQNAGNSLNFSLNDVLYPGSNPALQSTIDAAIRPLQQEWMNPGGVMSTIRTNAGEAGQVGSSRQGIAEGLAAQGFAQKAGDMSSQIATEGYKAGLDAMTRAQALAPTYAQMGTLPAQLQGTVGSMFDTQNQAFEDYNAAQRMWELNAPWTPLQNWASIVYGGASPSTVTSSTGGTRSNPLAPIGGAVGGYAMGASLASAPAFAAGGSMAAAAPFLGPAGAALGLLMALQ